MSILDLIAGQGSSPLEIAKARGAGETARSNLDTASLSRQATQARLDDYLGGREDARTKRTNDLRIQELKIQSMEEDDATKFTPMQPITVNGKNIGVGQYDADRKLYNFQSNRRLEGGKKPAKMPNVGEPSENQIDAAIKSVKTDEDLGEKGIFTVGFNSDDYKKIGRAVASRARQLKAQTKFLNETISDNDAMSLAKEEFKDMKDSTWDTSGGSRDLLKDIKFGSGISPALLNYLGVDSPEEDASGDIVEGPDGHKYRVLTRKEDGTPDEVELLE